MPRAFCSLTSFHIPNKKGAGKFPGADRKTLARCGQARSKKLFALLALRGRRRWPGPEVAAVVNGGTRRARRRLRCRSSSVALQHDRRHGILRFLDEDHLAIARHI